MRWRVAAAAVALAGLGWLASDLTAPSQVEWHRALMRGQSVQRADGLVLQDQIGRTLFASMGFSIYRSRAGGPFEKVITLLPTPGEAWAGFSRTFRDRLRYQELVELIALSDDELVAFAGGDVWRVDLTTGSAERTQRMRYFGRGKGRGVMPHGITMDDEGALYFGEYPTGELGDADTVRIYRSDDEGRTWAVAHEFAPHFVRHIHAVQFDPFSHAVWIATGDRDEESRIGYSFDGGATFQWIGEGSQRFRACSLMFTDHTVSWAMDAPLDESRLMSYDRATGAISGSIEALPGPGYYGRQIDGKRGVITLAERAAAVWVVEGTTARELVQWPVRPDPGLPHPAVRLLRSFRTGPDDWIEVNPLRTEVDTAAIYRIPASITTTAFPLRVARAVTVLPVRD